MGTLHDLARYGRCPHGVINRPGACPKCNLPADPQHYIELARKMGVKPGGVVHLCGSRGGRRFGIVVRVPEETA